MRLNVMASYLISLAFAGETIAGRPIGTTKVLEYDRLFPATPDRDSLLRVRPGSQSELIEKKLYVQTDSPSKVPDDDLVFKAFNRRPTKHTGVPFSYVLLHNDDQFWLHVRGLQEKRHFAIWSETKRIHSKAISIKKRDTKVIHIPKEDAERGVKIYHVEYQQVFP
ncbi:hypothetical protein PCANC_19925 [Puccinia coronata f. sp. avenae]|jgi:PAS domain-containing protein|uniref:Uncharacterized protein n=1 Tax=Puccinia coronata f. sp. avenae TaxID=200324 RepID=A0A2N5TT31_9BASI|nr:hypothetical protein PCANC_28458 [Puccinia coronata f. sp. avenae]PLW28647.1 hypothetical protein PCASD_18563 [Puccinia coronata f. sp. avenae]PLW32169.1 hypothetical protein PCANC_19925 [Puccinia coronata f. sp. avenae]